MWKSVKRFLVGAPISTAMADHERINNKTALAVFSSDALSSVAYSTEAILLVLLAAGSVAMGYLPPIVIGLAVLLTILTLSYRQTIHAYPSGGGAYIVAKDNLGTMPGLEKPKPAEYPATLNTLGDRLRARRLDLGLYQKDVAVLFGVTVDTICYRENNRVRPCKELLPKALVPLDQRLIRPDVRQPLYEILITFKLQSSSPICCMQVHHSNSLLCRKPV